MAKVFQQYAGHGGGTLKYLAKCGRTRAPLPPFTSCPTHFSTLVHHAHICPPFLDYREYTLIPIDRSKPAVLFADCKFFFFFPHLRAPSSIFFIFCVILITLLLSLHPTHCTEIEWTCKPFLFFSSKLY